jgi:hypothetical protein
VGRKRSTPLCSRVPSRSLSAPANVEELQHLAKNLDIDNVIVRDQYDIFIIVIVVVGPTTMLMLSTMLAVVVMTMRIVQENEQRHCQNSGDGLPCSTWLVSCAPASTMDRCCVGLGPNNGS